MEVGSIFLGGLIPPISRLQVFLWFPPSIHTPAICSEAASVSLARWRGPGPGPGVTEREVVPFSKSRAAPQQTPYGDLDQLPSEQRGTLRPARRLRPAKIHRPPACSKEQCGDLGARKELVCVHREGGCVAQGLGGRVWGSGYPGCSLALPPPRMLARRPTLLQAQIFHL